MKREPRILSSDLFDFNQVPYFVYHAPNRWRVFVLDRVVKPVKPQRLNRTPLVPRKTDGAYLPFYFYLSHFCKPRYL